MKQTDVRFQQGDKKPHIPALDGLRAIAILIVMFSHGAGNLPASWFQWAASGWVGVDLFFVLSGFLITEGLLKTKGATNYFWSFYGRRFLRIFPVFYLSLILLFLVIPRFISGIPTPTGSDQWFYWLYVNNWSAFMTTPNLHMVGHFWSLAVEEQFYLMWPAIVGFGSKKQLAWVAGVCLLLSPGLRLGLYLSGVDREAIYRNTFCRMDALMAGSLIAILMSNKAIREVVFGKSKFLAASGLTLVIATRLVFGFSYYQHARMLIFGFTLYAIGFAAVLPYCLDPTKKKILLSWTPFRYLALWSYGAYVYHLSIFYFVNRFLSGPGFPIFLSEVMFSFALAALSYHGMEERILRGKRWFAPQYRQGSVVAPLPTAAN